MNVRFQVFVRLYVFEFCCTGAAAIHHAASYGKQRLLKRLLELEPQLVHSTAAASTYAPVGGYLMGAHEGRTPLHFAAQVRETGQQRETG